MTTPKDLNQELDRCVMCGLCLPYCPTYQQTRLEAESPRGRISLMNALWHGKLPQEGKLEAHLNSCLTCRACEAVCPSGVDYGYLIDQTRQRLKATSGSDDGALARFALGHIVTHRARLRLAGVFLWLYQIFGIRKLAQLLGIVALTPQLKRLDNYLPPSQTPPIWRDYYPAKGAYKRDVALFTGCATENLDPNTLRAAIKVLTHCGYGVHIPRNQSCCGALHQHGGEHAQALTLMNRNASAFNQTNCRDVIVVATGCASMLSEYPVHLTVPPTWTVHDISDFLIKENALTPNQLRPLNKKVAIHTPCSMNNVLKLRQTTARLLAHIPEIALSTLDSNATCCGAAGSYMFSHPAMADALLTNKLNDIAHITPDILVTSNIGCALHLSAGLKRQTAPCSVVHPIELLAQQLASAG